MYNKKLSFTQKLSNNLSQTINHNEVGKNEELLDEINEGILKSVPQFGIKSKRSKKCKRRLTKSKKSKRRSTKSKKKSKRRSKK